jgi:arsenate reductase-like glutaredoxin family protein
MVSKDTRIISLNQADTTRHNTYILQLYQASTGTSHQTVLQYIQNLTNQQQIQDILEKALQNAEIETIVNALRNTGKLEEILQQANRLITFITLQ